MGSANRDNTNHTFRVLKHDIKNQLSNIQLALEGLKYEMPEQGEGVDIDLYMHSISESAKKIDKLLDGFE